MLGFVDTKSRLRVNVLKPGDIALIPQGWWHFHMNIGKEACQSLSAFSSEEAGVIVTHSALLTVPDAVLRATTASKHCEFGRREKEVDDQEGCAGTMQISSVSFCATKRRT
ncbi:hypothetical protein CBR_g28013 [Chara braunii]|uniref:Cupin type-1 domain-containing protein n=1 Tax=Chara braunii TaxID=69332 RepID=A0A388L8Z7_CHABU|nr:hypothetical protein CBR_g28013 [Chara braunii]|eukprot:GBG78789.1 hypothetical protein CBR_g28013 [Chara braunii]